MGISPGVIGCVHRIEGIALRVVRGKTVVVFAGDDNVLHARIFGQLGDLQGIELRRIKFLGKFLIIVQER